MRRRISLIIGLVFLLLLFSLSSIAPPIPHSIDGCIFYSGTHQVALGTDFIINNTNGSDYLRLVTHLPIPSQSGRYSETINGTDEESLLLIAWNISTYGRVDILMNGTMRNVNITLNISRDAEINLTIFYPFNNSEFIRGRTFLVNATLMALGSDAINCNATISIGNSSIFNLSSGENIIKNFPSIPFRTTVNATWIMNATLNGSTWINITSVCANEGLILDNMKAKAATNITIINAPLISLISPLNRSNSSNSTIFFSYQLLDFINQSSCQLVINNTLNQSNNSLIVINEINNITTPLSEGHFLWTVNCTNNDARQSTNSTPYLIIIDTTSPVITLDNPINQFSFGLTNLSLNYTVSDNNTGVRNCSLYHNFTGSFSLNQTQFSFGSFGPFLLPGGDYKWNVVCFDYAGNFNFSSINFTFNVSAPDINILTNYIHFTNHSPLEGELIGVNITVENKGSTVAENFTVKIMRDSIDGVQLLNFTIFLESKRNYTFNFTYIARVGLNNIFVNSDYNNTIMENDEDNNIANNSFSVDSYPFYFGNISSIIVLSTNTSLTISTWRTVTSTGNIYAADKDSAISFISLVALGKNISNLTSNNDFNELDIAMNMSTFNDSIFKKYTSNGTPLKLHNFTIFGKNVFNVPIVNSSNSSSFFTGILWDSSYDSGDGEFDLIDRETIVFIANVNASMEGNYGIYDYEINFPTLLREYEIPNTANSITFYTEIN